MMEETPSSERPVDISDWNREHVRQWMLEIQMDKKDADILYNEELNGAGLLHLMEPCRLLRKLSLNAIELIFQNIDLLKETPQCCSLKPYPFGRYDASYRYTEHGILDVTETGPKDLIQPCHEFKAFTYAKEEKHMKQKYIYEVIRFAAACMNSRTNGTIHFGVGDGPTYPHGKILGVSVPKTDDFDVWQKQAIETHFKSKKKEKVEKNVRVQIAKRCIKPPRFVEVLKADMTSSGKYVIEVDIEPSSIVCQDFYFKTFGVAQTEQANNTDKSFFIRDGSSTKKVDYDTYIKNNPRLSQEREEAEGKHLHAQGSELCKMITGGTHSMDLPYYTSYIVVANKSNPVQRKNLYFLLGLKLTAVLDVDPQSAENGLNDFYEKTSQNADSPAQHTVTGTAVEIASSLELTTKTSWVFCNGGINGETPSDDDNWLTEKGSSVRDVVSFLCQNVKKKCLVIFLLLNEVSKASDPLIQIFGMFLQELNRQNQILCISDNETSQPYWKDLINRQYKCDVSNTYIYMLSLAEINGTIVSLWPDFWKSIRFLPSSGGSKVMLSKLTEESLHMLSILCVNQCDGGHQDKQLHEENFYKGGKASWWNFSVQSGSASVIKRDKLDDIVNTIIPKVLNQKRACVFFNILHVQGCGGTTLAMHVLWKLREKYRCAVLKDTTEDYATAAKQVVQLLTYQTKEQPTRLPVLLMIDHFQDTRHVLTLQCHIEECLNQYSNSPQVIIVNCIRIEYCELPDRSDNVVFIPSQLSEKELALFEEKMEEFKKNNINTETFYVSMMMNNFKPDYIQGVVKNILKDFNFEHKRGQLFAVLVLLEVYSKKAMLSVSTCEEFLGPQTEAESRKVEDAFEKLSSLLKRCTVYSIEGMRVIHSKIAQHCLEELSASHGVTKAQIADLLLTTDLFYENTLEKQKFKQDVQDMIKMQDTRLIQDIRKENPGMEKSLLNAAECLREK